MKCCSVLVYIISSVHHAFLSFCIYFVDPTVFVLCAHVRYKFLIHTLLCYITKLQAENYSRQF